MIHFHQFNLKYVDLVCLWYDRDLISDGLLLYIRDGNLTKLLKDDFGSNIEILSVKINLRKGKWFFNDSYNPHKKNFESPKLLESCL